MKHLSILALIATLFLLPLSCTETDNEYSNREPSAGESVFLIGKSQMKVIEEVE